MSCSPGASKAEIPPRALETSRRPWLKFTRTCRQVQRDLASFSGSLRWESQCFELKASGDKSKMRMNGSRCTQPKEISLESLRKRGSRKSFKIQTSATLRHWHARFETWRDWGWLCLVRVVHHNEVMITLHLFFRSCQRISPAVFGPAPQTHRADQICRTLRNVTPMSFINPTQPSPLSGRGPPASECWHRSVTSDNSACSCSRLGARK